MKTYNIKRPIEIEFEPAHLSHDDLRAKVEAIAQRYNFQPSQSDILLRHIWELGGSDKLIKSPELLNPDLLPQALSIFALTRPQQRDFLMQHFGGEYEPNASLFDPDFAEFFNIGLESFVVSDFEISDSDCFIVFKVVVDDDTTLKDIEDCLDASISGAWGEDFTSQIEVSVDVRTIQELTWHSVMLRHQDILLHDYEPPVVQYFSNKNKSRLIVDDSELTKMSRLANTVNIRAFVMTH